VSEQTSVNGGEAKVVNKKYQAFERYSTSVNSPHNNALIHELFGLIVSEHGDRTAVVFPDFPEGAEKKLSYAELDKAAGLLATRLGSLGVAHGDLVGLYIERSVEMVIAMLAILKAGAAYVPLDPAYPSERLGFMLKDAHASLVLTQTSLRENLNLDGNVLVVCLDEDDDVVSEKCALFERGGAANDLSCLLYTSGSTGRPKGVEVPHRSITRLVMNTDYTRFDDSRVFLQLVPISFDVAAFEIWGALLHGATCVLYPQHGVPDPQLLQRVLMQYRVTTLWLTTSLFNTIIDDTPEVLASVEELLVGGEALSVPHIVKAQKHLPNTQLINGYGPTESNITTCYRIPRPFNPTLKSVPIGRPIANSTVYILDGEMQPVGIGEEGELYIGGAGVARGYLNQPELTAEKFIADPFSSESGISLYRSGDRARYLSDGNIDFIGRNDDQVKIDGHRIELGEIEATIRKQSGVKDVGVVVHLSAAGNKQLVAYISFADKASDVMDVRRSLEVQLPDYMVPLHWIILDKIPLTANGKLDRRALPTPEQSRPELDVLYVAPKTEQEQKFVSVWRDLLMLDDIGINDNFFELGGTSLLSLQCVARLRRDHNIDVPIANMFQYPTISELIVELETGVANIPGYRKRTRQDTSQGGVAIIGMAGRFPGASDVATLWKNVCDGVESITYFDADELDTTIPVSLKNDKNYVAARGVLEGVDKFDAAFFGISALEAKIMDPQQRIFLEVVWQALEDSGYDPERYAGLVGLYGGMNSNTYFANNVQHHRDDVERLGEFQTMLANEKDYLTTRASFKIGLKGPSVNVYTACSTSLTAVCYAVDGLLNQQCDMAVAGGVSVIVPQNSGYLYQDGGMFARDGHCRPFDADATGTTFNSGVGLVVLKREEDARRDGDTIYAVIRGTGVNNDGSGKASFTAPSIDGQAAAIRMAMDQAGFDPSTIGYIEAHGTGTPLGDPIEIAGLRKAFGDDVPAHSCALGSIKGNVGHLIHAAGVTGLIKTALALKHKKLPPNVNYTSLNPNIDSANSPFYVSDKLENWQAGETPLRAGVSSFGVGGTNAHVVLEAVIEEDVPSSLAAVDSLIKRPRELLLLSARSDAALARNTSTLQAYLQHTNVGLDDIAYTLMVGRRGFEQRRMVVVQDTQDASQVLTELSAKRVSTRSLKGGEPPVVFMFPGQGAQYTDMGRNIFDVEPVFRDAMTQCRDILLPLVGWDLLEVLYSAGSAEDAGERLRQTAYTQPLLFAIEYSLARLWQSWGVQPEAMIGHSIGEFVAACLADVFSLEDGLSLVAHRARLMQARPAGTMLSVRMAAEQIEPRLSGQMAIAAVNGPELCVVSGALDEMDALQKSLEGEGIVCRPLHTSHAFHSPMMDEVIEPFLKKCCEIKLSAPKIAFISTVTADWITDAQATDPSYWARHLRETVRFSEGVKALWQHPERLLLEVGPRTTAATLARQQSTDKRQQVALSSLNDSAEDNAEWGALLGALGQLWLCGVNIDWSLYYKDQARKRVPLPTYSFERERHWLDALPQTSQQAMPATSGEHNLQMSEPLMQNRQNDPAAPNRKEMLILNIGQVMEDASGIQVVGAESDMSFLELGFDSLVLTQASLALKNKFKVDITFRQLLEEFTTLDDLAVYLDSVLPAGQFEPERAASATTPVADVALSSIGDVAASVSQVLSERAVNASAIETVISQQLQLMARQLEMLGIPAGTLPVVDPESTVIAAETKAAAIAPTSKSAPDKQTIPSRAHGPAVRIQRSTGDTLTAIQQKWLDEFAVRYNQRTQQSKQEAQANRAHLADPRTVSGFKPVWKELVYPIVVERSKGSKLWDVDGHEYVDLACGFGSNMFGWAAPFIIDAVEKQLHIGYEVGPQTRLAGEVAKQVCEMTGNERVAFCNTGSEAVLGAIRLARTVTGRNTIVIFNGGYHGIVDEVIVRGSQSLRSYPAAPGIPADMVKNILVLEYGTPETLTILESRKDELAAILVETVQSRKPDLQPIDFLHQLRALTDECDAALIFDEVITGFRVHPAGMQGYTGIRADLVTYGKVIGGGMPIGLIAGKARFMDALDGGQWQFGDSSIPEVGVTFFAGTFVRHPLVLAAAKAVMDRLETEGEALQHSLAERTQYLAEQVNGLFETAAAPYRLPYFTSFFYLTYPQEQTHGGLLFYLLREKGVHIWEGRPCFLTTAHSDEDIEFIIKAFKESIQELQRGEFIDTSPEIEGESFDANKPPVPGARLGKDPEGNPAWYVEDPDRPGKYMKVSGA